MKADDFNVGDSVKITNSEGFAIITGGWIPSKDLQYPVIGTITNKQRIMFATFCVGYAIAVNGVGFKLNNLIEHNFIEKI